MTDTQRNALARWARAHAAVCEAQAALTGGSYTPLHHRLLEEAQAARDAADALEVRVVVVRE